jgi:hypothetical protein
MSTPLCAKVAGFSFHAARLVHATIVTRSRGPKVLVDEGHFSMHAIDGRYAPFAALLRRDGYVVGLLPRISCRQK